MAAFFGVSAEVFSVIMTAYPEAVKVKVVRGFGGGARPALCLANEAAAGGAHIARPVDGARHPLSLARRWVAFCTTAFLAI
eukprot:4951021-Prymnesium_polylepis.1